MDWAGNRLRWPWLRYTWAGLFIGLADHALSWLLAKLVMF